MKPNAQKDVSLDIAVANARIVAIADLVRTVTGPGHGAEELFDSTISNAMDAIIALAHRADDLNKEQSSGLRSAA